MAAAGQEGDDGAPTLPGSLTVGDGWSLQVRPRDQTKIQVHLDSADGLPVLVKQITRNPCRLVRAVSADSAGRSPALTVRARSTPGLINGWLSVS